MAVMYGRWSGPMMRVVAGVMPPVVSGRPMVSMAAVLMLVM